MAKAIEIRNLGFRYPDGTEALKDVNLEIDVNESVSLIGPNGGGKTTLLLHLNGILMASEGEVKVSGMKVEDSNLRDIRRKVGVVFQDPDDQLFMPTVFDDVAFGPLNMGLPEDEVKEIVTSTLERVGLKGFEDKSPQNLSFGEKKKVSFATVLSMNPEILVLDEPTANLDPRSRRELMGLIKDLKREGKTLIITTHDVNAIPEIVDKVYIINKKIVGGGTPREIFLDTELLKKSNLEIPLIAQLFHVLSCFGYDTREVPLSFKEAVSHLLRTIEEGDGHLHLHIHKHTHREIDKIKKIHEHSD